jgi:hypothetical protein
MIASSLLSAIGGLLKVQIKIVNALAMEKPPSGDRQYEGLPEIEYRGLAAEDSIPHILREAKDYEERILHWDGCAQGFYPDGGVCRNG